MVWRVTRRKLLRLLLAAPAAVLMLTRALADGLEQGMRAQPLSEALEAFARETGYQMVYRTELVSGVNTKGAPAGLSAAETLRELLRDTGLVFMFVNERTVAIVKSGDATGVGTGKKEQRRAGSLAQADSPSEVSSDMNRTPEETNVVNQKKGLVACLAAIFALCGPLMLGGRAYCQEAAADQTAGSDALQEVVVTAERREENVQTTSISMTVISQDSLAEHQERIPQDLQKSVPNLQFSGNVTIRGIGDTPGSAVGAASPASPRLPMAYSGRRPVAATSPRRSLICRTSKSLRGRRAPSLAQHRPPAPSRSIRRSQCWVRTLTATLMRNTAITPTSK